jgi:hypothetical protein
VRAPAASTLPGLLGLQRSLRPLVGYRPRVQSVTRVLDEPMTADLSAQSGAVQPVMVPARQPETELLLLMDASPTSSVWQLTFEKLRQTCERLGAFRDVQALYLHRGSGGTPLIGTAADGSGARLRPAGQYRDTTGRRLTLVVSDCVGPLWQDGGAQRLLHSWAARASLAVVQPLPPRLWPRTALPGEPGLLIRDEGQNGPVAFEPDGHTRRPIDALAVPVLLPTPAALGAWARLLGGEGRQTVRGAAAWVLPRHHAMPAPAAAGGATPRELLGAFRASASPGALDLAVHLAAVPLLLPVIQLVQEAMFPDTGPMELAEVLLSGLLERLPDVEGSPGPRYDFARGVRELLLQSLEPGAARLMLKHLSEYVTRRFGKGTRNFPALAVARMGGREAEEESGSGRGLPPDDVPDELFAEIPARVMRFYDHDRAEHRHNSEVAAAEAHLRRWREQGDPWLLAEAKTHAEAAVAAAETRARLVLGQVLHAMIRTAEVRRDPGRAHELLREAETLLSGDTIETRLELAAVRYELWKADGDRAHLRAAVTTLRATGETGHPDGPPQEKDEAERRLWLGRVLLALCRTETASSAEQRSYAVQAAAELGAAAERLSAAEGPADRLCGALLDRSAALRRAGAGIPERLENLDRADTAAGDDDGLRLRCARGRARVHRDGGDLAAADAAFAAAEVFTGRDSLERAELLTEWGTMLLGSQAEAASGRAEGLLREALTTAPAEGALASRLRLLLGGALVARYDREQFLPDLYEGCHLLEQAARKAPEGELRAEAWLLLGRARQLYPAGHLPPGRAYEALTRSLTEARQARETAPASVAVARALAARADLHQRLGQPRAALGDYRAAADEWQRLAGDLAEDIPWDEVRQTRERIADLEAG